MPIYEYRCLMCGTLVEQFRKIADRNEPPDCEICRAPCPRVVSVTQNNPWKSDRVFDNLGESGMSFGSEAEYKAYKREHHIVELAHDGKVRRAHGNRVVFSDGKSSQPGGSAGSAASRGYWSDPH